MTTWSTWVSAAGEESIPVQPWVQAGVLGVLSFALLSFLLWLARSAIQRERDRADQAETQRQEAEKAVRDLYEKVLPVMSQAGTVMGKLADIMPDLVHALRNSSSRNSGS